jgi:hypothetical protein
MTVLAFEAGLAAGGVLVVSGVPERMYMVLGFLVAGVVPSMTWQPGET